MNSVHSQRTKDASERETWAFFKSFLFCACPRPIFQEPGDKNESVRLQTPGQMRLLARRGNVYGLLEMRMGRECGFNLETIVLPLRFDIRNVREGERSTGRVMEDFGFVFISHFIFWVGNCLFCVWAFWVCL